MSKQIEALKLALEALEIATTPLAKDRQEVLRARTAIREAMAEQPEQDWGAAAEKHLAALKKSTKATTEDAAVRAVHKTAQDYGLIDIGRIFTPEQPAQEKAPQSANCEAPGWISSDHARGNDCTTEQPYPDNFIDALKYDVAKRDSEAQPEQEPVAWMFQHEETGRTMCVDAQQVEWGFEKGNPRLKKIAPLYTSPPASKPLTDAQIMRIARKSGLDLEPPAKMSWVEVQGRHEHLLIFARAIEAKIKEKNA